MIDFCSFGFTIGGGFYFYFSFVVEGDRGRGRTTLIAFDPPRQRRRRFFFFNEARFIFFLFAREWETYCADNLSDLGAHKDRWNGILVVAAANFSVRDDQCYYVKLVLSCLEDLNRSVPDS